MLGDESEDWQRLKGIARDLTRRYPGAVFIGGIAVYYHASVLGHEFQEASHDADLYLSLTGKSEIRDEYEVRRNERLNKDSLLINGEDVDLYVEHQHKLGVPYDIVFAYAQMTHGVRVARLEHLLILKLDAAKDRYASAKGDKDIRDIVKIVALLEDPRPDLLKPFFTVERAEILERVLSRKDLNKVLGLNAFEANRFVAKVKRHGVSISHAWNGHERQRTGRR